MQISHTSFPVTFFFTMFLRLYSFVRLETEVRNALHYCSQEILYIGYPYILQPPMKYIQKMQSIFYWGWKMLCKEGWESIKQNFLYHSQNVSLFGICILWEYAIIPPFYRTNTFSAIKLSCTSWDAFKQKNSKEAAKILCQVYIEKYALRYFGCIHITNWSWFNICTISMEDVDQRKKKELWLTNACTHCLQTAIPKILCEWTINSFCQYYSSSSLN